MTQTPRPQEGKTEKISFPDSKFLMMRQSLADICYGSRSAGKLLSVLLGWYTHDKKTTPEQQTFTIQLTQKKIIEDLCGELNVKTLHDTAVPVLFALEYIDIQISTYVHTYTVHLDRVRQALALVKKPEQLEKLLITTIDQQLEKLLIAIPETIRETSNNNKKKFQLLLEKVLIVIGESSNSRRGRKPRQEAASSTQNEAPYTIETIRDSEETFLGAHESPSTPEDQPPSEEKKSDVIIGTLETVSYSPDTTATNVSSESSWLQEDQESHVNPPSQATVAITHVAPPIAEPVPLIPPAEQKPVSKHVFGNLREGLGERDVRQVSQKDQARMDAAEQREKERLAKKRGQEIFCLFDKLFGSQVDRLGFNKGHVTSLSTNTLATDEIITTAFNTIANDARTKTDPTRLTITNIANVIPALIRAEQIKAVPSQSKPKSIDEKIAESERAAKEFEADQKAKREARLAREAQERMAVAQ